METTHKGHKPTHVRNADLFFEKLHRTKRCHNVWRPNQAWLHVHSQFASSETLHINLKLIIILGKLTAGKHP